MKKKIVSVITMIDDLQEKLNDVKEHVIRFEERKINAAGGRARKGLQEIKKAVKPIRDAIQEIKNERKGK